jgi:hypothetical protein
VVELNSQVPRSSAKEAEAEQDACHGPSSGIKEATAVSGDLRGGFDPGSNAGGKLRRLECF